VPPGYATPSLWDKQKTQSASCVTGMMMEYAGGRSAMASEGS